jgi:hypothetical protein
VQDSHLLYRYSSRHIHFLPLHKPFGSASPLTGTLAYHSYASAASAPDLFPIIIGARTPRPVSYYALFKWWLLLSQHPGCHSNLTSLRTKSSSGALAGGLDCFPFDHGYYHPWTDSQTRLYGIRSLVGVGRRVAPQPHPVALPPYSCNLRLTLKLFRGERAISRFDWTLTPPHSSSQLFNDNGFGPPGGFTPPSPWPWVDHTGFASSPMRLNALFRLGFPSPPARSGLNLAAETNSWAHYAKGTPSPRRAPTACKRTVSGTLSLRSSRYFSSFSHLTGSLSVVEEYLALEGGPPIFNPGSTSPSLL